MSDIKKIDNTKTPTSIVLDKNDFDDYKSYKKEYDRQYSILKRKRRREIYALNREYKQKQQRDYLKKNKEKINNDRQKKYKDDEEKYKKVMQWSWKRSGIIIDENTFDYYDSINNCELCNVEFCERGGKSRTNKKCLDHDHLTGHIRCVICYKCNNYLKKYDRQRLELMLAIHRYFKEVV